MDILVWIQNWYKSQCNGNWEHNFGIIIETIDNPGWSVTIDTNETNIVLPDMAWVLIENSKFNWYGYKVMDGIFEGSGDPNKLVDLLSQFKSLIHQNTRINKH